MLYNPPTGGAANDPYVGKNAAAGIQGSKIPPGAAEFPQREIVAVISDAGMTPTNADLAQMSQAVRSGKLNYFVDSGTADALLIKPARAYADVGAGTEFAILKGASPNATTTPTLTVSGTTLTIVREDGSALAAGDLPANCLFTVRSDGTRLHVQGLRKGELVTSISNNYAKGSLIGRRVYSTPGTFTYTPTPGTASIRVIVQAAGGSGGSTQATGSGQYALAGGGASGGRADSDIADGFSGQSIIVGAGGSGNANGMSGSAGGSSSFGNLISATGGQGGAGSPPGNNPAVQAGGSPGYGSGGNVANIPGAPGLIASGTSFTNFCSGGGAASTFGGGGTPIYPASGPGNQGYGYGSGGSGAGASANMPILAGGSGANGCVIIEEFD